MIRKKSKTILLLAAVTTFILLNSCNPATKFEKEEAATIEDYLTNNSNLNFSIQPSGLYYLELEAGTGRQPITSDTASVIYTGSFLDGRVFDTNVGSDLLTRPVNEGLLILGFDEGITLMKEGGKALLLIPSNLAYGTQGYYGVPGYTPLLFDVELVSVKPGPGK